MFFCNFILFVRFKTFYWNFLKYVYFSGIPIYILISLLLLVCYCLQSSFVGAIAIGDLIKSTLGPKGMVSMNLFLP